MKKNSIYTSIFLAITLLIFSSCSGGVQTAGTLNAAPAETIEAVPAPLPSESEVIVEDDSILSEIRQNIWLSDAKMLVGLLDHDYAMLDWKEEYLKMSFDDYSESYLDEVRACKSDIDF